MSFLGPRDGRRHKKDTRNEGVFFLGGPSVGVKAEWLREECSNCLLILELSHQLNFNREPQRRKLIQWRYFLVARQQKGAESHIFSQL